NAQAEVRTVAAVGDAAQHVPERIVDSCWGSAPTELAAAPADARPAPAPAPPAGDTRARPPSRADPPATAARRSDRAATRSEARRAQADDDEAGSYSPPKARLVQVPSSQRLPIPLPPGTGAAPGSDAEPADAPAGGAAQPASRPATGPAAAPAPRR